MNDSEAVKPLRAGNRLSVNGLDMYYELHGAGEPLLLLHGALSTIGTSFGAVLPSLCKSRRLVAVEQQGHGHTADVDRRLSYAQMAEDTAALLRELEIQATDVFGYSMGAGVALELAIRHPGLVRKLALASLAYSRDGIHPEALEAIESTSAEDLAGSIFETAYASVAPDPENWGGLVAKVNELDREFEGWSPEDIESIRAPALVLIGDSDIVRPEHAVQLFRLRGGGVEGDAAGLPESQLGVLPGTTHLTLVERGDWLVSMISAFLDAPTPGVTR
jgi:pimeloyl-ACP methyl ester carboxylesterase